MFFCIVTSALITAWGNLISHIWRFYLKISHGKSCGENGSQLSPRCCYVAKTILGSRWARTEASIVLQRLLPLGYNRLGRHVDCTANGDWQFG